MTTRVVISGVAGLVFLATYAPAACLFLIFVYAQGILLYVTLRRLPRGTRLRKYAPYLILLNLFFVDFSQAILGYDIILIGVSFSVVRIFIAIKQFVNSRKKLVFEYYIWSFMGLFYLPTLFVGPIFSPYKLWMNSIKGPAQRDSLPREFRIIAFGLIMAVIASPFFTKILQRSPEIIFNVINKLAPSMLAMSEAHFDIWFYPLKLLALFLALFTAFWGQSLIAETSSRLYGFKVPANFDRPWLATDIRDFWRRWHISMAEFVMNYIFIPLNLAGVNSRVSIFLAFIFMGLWHNTSLGYFLWGVGHGTLLALWPQQPEQATKKHVILGRVATFVSVIFLSYVGNYAFN